MSFVWSEYLTALRNVTRQYRRSLFGIAAVAFGVVALLLAAGFIEWIFWATREGTIQGGLGHVQVMRAGYLDEGHADPWRFLMPQSSAQQEAIEKFSGVRVMAPRLAFNGLVSHGDTTVSFVGEGVNPEKELEVSRTLLITSGQNLSSDAPKGVLLGRGLADNLGVKVGDMVVLMTNTPSGSLNALEFTVRGLFTTVSKAYDDSALRIPLPMTQKLLRISGVHRWILVLDDTQLTARATRDLREGFRDTGLDFVPWYQLADFYNKLVALLSNQLGGVKLIIAVIIVLSISNTMMMNVLERTSEIGTRLAMGSTTRQILRQFIYEGLTIGLIGGTLGLTLGGLLASLISYIGIPMPPPPGMSQGYSGEILITGTLAINAFMLALGTTLLASIYPAWKASRLEIVDALRHSR
ncbi:LolE permease component of an ABC-transporter system [Candidatus Propionivibrio aalborgensis]|uniref:LolE permease component of an ABC-transporter system n=1 Tax=Candidatus Propionivibrio aalborgensis TaxID=1860101 RepID=A0A1A8XVR7_9RHOO|nr:FtsX-like permease family protein [Candidatus Propionivibrio aalborgensis]SBT08078.1 LolE permease component of an ABC-transporter system [Candidatus Propionivibrio aalborgensis]